MKKYRYQIIELLLIVCTVLIFAYMGTHEHANANEPIYKTVINH